MNVEVHPLVRFAPGVSFKPAVYSNAPVNWNLLFEKEIGNKLASRRPGHQAQPLQPQQTSDHRQLPVRTHPLPERNPFRVTISAHGEKQQQRSPAAARR